MDRLAVQQATFDVGAELAALSLQPGVGGLGCFVGQVRGDGGLVALTLEHYPGMTERALAGIVAQARARWDLLGCCVIHRVGRLPVGAPIVLVAATSAHRQPALDATRFLIDWLKTDAPLWKQESFADGTVRWVAPRGGDDAARAAWISPRSSV